MAPSATIHKHRGLVLVMVLVFLAAISAISIVIFQRTNSSTTSTSQRVNTQAALRIAEAGIEKAVWCLNNPSIWNSADCPGTSYVGETNVSFGNGTFTTSVNVTGNTATINSTGTVRGSGGTSTKELQVKLNTTSASVSFQYGLQAGVGGIEMDGNGNVITGNVFANGPVTGAGNGNIITGDVVLAPSNPVIEATATPSPAASTIFGRNTTQYVVQSFIPNINDKVVKIDLKIARTSSAPNNMSLGIYDDNGGAPGTQLSALTVAATAFPLDTAPGWENTWTSVTYTPQEQLAPSATYWVVMQLASNNNSRYYTVRHSSSGDVYTDGQARFGTSPTTGLADVGCSTCDIGFQVHMGGTNPTLNIKNVGGKAIAHTITSTIVGQHACYQALSGSVTAHAETCTLSSVGTNPCIAVNTQINTPDDPAPPGGTTSYCHPGNANPVAADFPLSPEDIADMEAQAALGGTVPCPSGCTVSSGTIGPKKYDGDLTISSNVTLLGTVWARGNIYLNGNLTLSTAYGGNSGVIIADDVIAPNDTTKGRIDVTGGDLLGYVYDPTPANPTSGDEKDTLIMAIAMSKSLSSDENQAAWPVKNNLTAAVVYAANGSVYMKNNSSLSEITGQKIYMKGNTTLTYKTGLAQAIFSSGPGGSWAYDRGTYQVID